MTQLRLPGACGVAALVMVLSCSGPNEPEPAGPAAIISLDTVSTLPGTVVDVSLQIEYTGDHGGRLDSLGGFQFNIAYDDRALSFLGGIEPGPSISEWEYFTYRYVAGSDKFIYQPARLWVKAIRNMDNGQPVVPPQTYPEGTLATVSFQATADWDYIDSTITLFFQTDACGDNILQPHDALNHYYIATSSFAGDMTAMTDTMSCARRFSVEPLLGFRGGSVTIVEPTPGDTLNLDGP